MALVQTVETRYHIDATYWRILGLDHNVDTQQAIVFFAGYASKQARLDGARPIIEYQYTIEDLAPVLAGADITRALVYDWIKTLPEWVNATDDI